MEEPALDYVDPDGAQTENYDDQHDDLRSSVTTGGSKKKPALS